MMRGKIGTFTTCNSIIPNFKELYRIYPKKLSREAKQRLRVLDYFYNKAHKKVSVTARYFGVSRTYIYKWIKRYNRWDLATLESRSRRPKRVRTVQYDTHAVNTIRKIRQEYPSFSAVKVSVILLRDYAIKLSSATVGRIIRRFNLFFSKAITLRKNLSKAAAKGWQTRKAKERLRHYLKPDRPRHIIEFDMKHIKNGGVNQYALCAIDTYTKEALIHISSSCTARQASIAIQKVLDRFGTNITIVCDNGSENFGATFDLLANSNVRQLFARPNTPKDKPHIENFIGKYQKECLNESDNRQYSVKERQLEADK